ncbi:MAG: type II toxin-antitoxin system HicA family toxin [Acidobacteriia bacterium]|nr:type II toxin-antitoxin system HicA family toxin [Terriglobia bacterium]
MGRLARGKRRSLGRRRLRHRRHPASARSGQEGPGSKLLTRSRLRTQVGSHRQFVHRVKPGKLTIAGHPSGEVPKGTMASILKQAGLNR